MIDLNIRDVFLICCYTGLSFNDAKSLSTSHIFSDKRWVNLYSEKQAKNRYCFLLYQSFLSLGKSWSNMHTILQIKKQYDSSYSNQKYNLREIADLCGIQKHLTIQARHTFAITVEIINEIPEHIVAHIRELKYITSKELLL